MIRDYFRGKTNYLRMLLDAVEPGEVLSAREITDRTNINRTKVYSLMPTLVVKGIVERVPYECPDPPEGSELWGRRRWGNWRREVKPLGGKFPTLKWRIIGISVIPVDELLRIAKLDLAAFLEKAEC